MGFRLGVSEPGEPHSQGLRAGQLQEYVGVVVALCLTKLNRGAFGYLNAQNEDPMTHSILIVKVGLCKILLWNRFV